MDTNEDDRGQTIAIQSDGKIIVGGSTGDIAGGANFLIARYNQDGSLDDTFDSDGIKITDISSGYDMVSSIVLQDDGKIIATGIGSEDFVAVRYFSDGRLDTTFGNGGVFRIDINGRQDYSWTIKELEDGKYLIGGESYNPEIGRKTVALIRLDHDGTIDPTFDNDGILLTDIIQLTIDPGNIILGNIHNRSMTIQEDGKIVIFGLIAYAQIEQDSSFSFFSKPFIARYLENGILDENFGINGITYTETDSLWFFGDSGSIQSDGKFVFGGLDCNLTISEWYEGCRSTIIRFNENGFLDSNFGENGFVYLETEGGNGIDGVWLGIEDEIFAVGFSEWYDSSQKSKTLIAKWNTDGSLDQEFGDNGLIFLDLNPNGVETAEFIFPAGDGGLIATGWVSNEEFRYDVSLIKFLINNSPVISTDQELIEVLEGEIASNSGALSDPDNNPITLNASSGTVILNNEQSIWSWNLKTDDGPNNSQTIVVTADDGNGGIAETNFEIVVKNVPPRIEVINAPRDPVQLGAEIIGRVEFFDPGGEFDEPYTCTIDFGDGNGNFSGVVIGNTCETPPYYYASPGVYSITFNITDKDNDTGSGFYEYVVVYNPDGGFVTGGGWIWSEAGYCYLYEDCASAEGKANFGFVSKYKKGASIPTGNTEFQFKAGNLNFHSESYQWLVVAGDTAKYKGVGTINGEGEYKFMIWAIDGDLSDPAQADKFRIKIWLEDDSGYETIIYDNGFEQEIGGGNIVVHTEK